MKQVVIIGGSYAAITAFKLVLAQTEPVHITVISPSEYTWNNTSSPRLLIQPERKKETIVNLKQLIDTSLQNSIHKGTFLQAVVSKVDLDENVVFYKHKKLVYDYLVIATGSRYESDAFKLSNSADYQKSFDSIDDLSKKIKAAKSIAIIGGGAAGVEVSGELGYNYPTKKIDLYTGTSAPLAQLKDSNRKSAQTRLQKLNIKVINNIKVDSYSDNEIKFNNTTKEYDLVIPTFKSTPNAEFLNSQVLKDGFVNVDKSFFVKGYPQVIAFGDVASITAKALADIKYVQAGVVKASINHWFKQLDLKEYKTKKMLVVPISKSGGVGEAFGRNFPSFLIKIVKGKDFGIKNSKKFLS